MGRDRGRGLIAAARSASSYKIVWAEALTVKRLFSVGYLEDGNLMHGMHEPHAPCELVSCS
ncbi:hypothetical protein WME88_00670 [Sorangium sp. So ce216]